MNGNLGETLLLKKGDCILGDRRAQFDIRGWAKVGVACDLETLALCKPTFPRNKVGKKKKSALIMVVHEMYFVNNNRPDKWTLVRMGGFLLLSLAKKCKK